MAVQGPENLSRHSQERTNSIVEWSANFEKAFCVKIIQSYDDLDEYKEVIQMDTKELFKLEHDLSIGGFDDYVEFQSHNIREYYCLVSFFLLTNLLFTPIFILAFCLPTYAGTLFRYPNRGRGVNMQNKPVLDMCSVLNAIFRNSDDYGKKTYSVIHSRSLEGEPGMRILSKISKLSGCDPMAALDMQPDYIKAILEPQGMLEHPIIFITDRQRPEILEKLLADPGIGPNIRLIPDEASWIGGDLAVAIMSTVFIGNPASTFSGFIAKSRLALGFESTFMFRKKNEEGEWVNVCDNHCIFDKEIMRAMA